MEYIPGKISIIMAVHDCEATLHEAIDSILAQTYTNWEFIVCDDGSTDGTARILDEYAQKHPGKFKILRNEQNLFLSASLNRCLKLADGEFTARMDGDDWCPENRFERQMWYLREHKNVDMVGTLRRAYDGKQLGKTIGTYKEIPDKYELRFGSCFVHASVMMYTRVFHELGGYTVSRRTVRSQDYDLWIRFFAHGYCGANMQEILYYERIDDKSYLRRKPKVYLWQIASRWICFRTLHYPIWYYWRLLEPLAHLAVNECRKLRARLLG